MGREQVRKEQGAPHEPQGRARRSARAGLDGRSQKRRARSDAPYRPSQVQGFKARNSIWANSLPVRGGEGTNDPKHTDDPEYIVRLLGQVITVSLETVKVVKGLPPLEKVDAP